MGLCTDASNKGKQGNGDTEVSINSQNNLDDVMNLIKQAYYNSVF
jgi:predicted transport protein